MERLFLLVYWGLSYFRFFISLVIGFLGGVWGFSGFCVDIVDFFLVVSMGYILIY